MTKEERARVYRPTSKLAELAATFQSAKETKKDDRDRDRDREREKDKDRDRDREQRFESRSVCLLLIKKLCFSFYFRFCALG